MLRTTQPFITPSKLSRQPQESLRPSSIPPLQQLLMVPTKVPKLFSAFRPPSVQPRPKSQKFRLTNDMPSFLCEFLNCTESKITHQVSRKLVTQDQRKRERILKPEYKPQTSESKSSTPAYYELNDCRKLNNNGFYRPYIVEISPRAKIRLYSPSPILPVYESKSLKNTRKNKRKKQREFEVETKKDPEIKVIPVEINEYTKTYAEKLKKVLEISEAARIEASKIKF